MPKVAGVVIDAYKLEVFRKHFTAANLKWTEVRGPKKCITLRVEYDMVANIQPIIEAANKEATK